MSIQSVTGTFVAAANGSSFMPERNQDPRFVADYNVAVWGTFVGTVVLEKSFDAGVTWIPVLRLNTATAVSYTTPSAEMFYEPEDSVLVRLRCSAYTSGTISYRLSQ
jgi:hypothetical protein